MVWVLGNWAVGNFTQNQASQLLENTEKSSQDGLREISNLSNYFPSGKIHICGSVRQCSPAFQFEEAPFRTGGSLEV